jgi:hypothetical protein
MSLRDVGIRVGAISHADEETVYLFGYGVYDGDKVPPEELKVQAFGILLDRPNPQITLDDGKLVFGCECWWGPEEKVKTMIGSRKVVVVDIEAARKAFQATQ